MFFPDDHQTIPRNIVDVMAALDAWRVWTGSAAACGSYDHRERREVHYLWPEGHPVEELFHKRLAGPAEAVAPDGGQTGDIHDLLVVDDDPQPQDDLEPRTKRAVDEAMDVSPMEILLPQQTTVIVIVLWTVSTASRKEQENRKTAP